MPPAPTNKNGLATLEQRDGLKLPVLTTSTVTPQVLAEYKDGCKAYFYYKSVVPDWQVGAIIFSLKDTRIKDWACALSAVVLVMTFDNFMTELRTCLLTVGWELTLQQEILSARQKISTPFDEWKNSFGAKNSLLLDTNYHVEESTFRNHLNANMTSELSNNCTDLDLHLILDFQTWSDAVTIADRKCIHEIEKQHCLVDEAVKATATRSKVLTTSSKVNKPVTSSSATSTTASGFPKLTQAEKDLLAEHEGCFCCHLPYAGHHARDCKGTAADAVYKPLTVADALLAKRNKESTCIAAITEAPTAFVAVAGFSSLVIGSSSESDSYVTPLQTPHFYWDCQIDSAHLESPVSVHALIDNGSSLILISPELATQL